MDLIKPFDKFATVTEFLQDIITKNVPECKSFHYNDFSRLQPGKSIKYPSIERSLRDEDILTKSKFHYQFSTVENFLFAVQITKDPDIREANPSEELYEQQCLSLMISFLEALKSFGVDFEIISRLRWYRRETSTRALVLSVDMTFNNIANICLKQVKPVVQKWLMSDVKTGDNLRGKTIKFDQISNVVRKGISSIYLSTDGLNSAQSRKYFIRSYVNESGSINIIQITEHQIPEYPNGRQTNIFYEGNWYLDSYKLTNDMDLIVSGERLDASDEPTIWGWNNAYLE